MSLEDFNGTDSIKPSSETFSNASEKVTLALSHIDQRKFVVPFQGGYDGDNPANPKLSGADIVATNTQGFDISEYIKYNNTLML